MISPCLPTLVLFSGLAADEDVFRWQKQAFPKLIVPEWPIPDVKDTLDTYCKRIAAQLSSDVRVCQDNLVVGGASFGGIIAFHVAKYLEPKAIILIGSVQTPFELPLRIRALRPLKAFIFSAVANSTVSGNWPSL
ncbi:MAG: hypothetical protein KDB03_21290 [Planctomycetales bacterium]|nr:hypothetical protein [Planctomycetales bacterium]